VITEERVDFACFGGRVSIVASGDADLRLIRSRFATWHRMLTRFDPTSELSLLNASRAARVKVSPIMATFVGVAIDAAHRTDGLVDPTLGEEIERAGYRSDLRDPLDLVTSLELAPERRPARPHPDRRWLDLTLDGYTVSRRRRVKLDTGGIAKGLFADLAAGLLSGSGSYAVDCAGDVAIGGTDGLARPVLVDDPFGGEPLHEFAVEQGGVATSGIGRRSWIGPDGRPAHHLLDPSTGRPAYTGVVQATALAPTATEAEVLAKAALLSGDHQWLTHGGALVFDDASHAVVGPA
jgi:thiamine biosynthesis lipoprotein